MPSSSPIALLAPAALALVLGALLGNRLVARADLLDHPNERSLHRVPVPRTGGLAVLGGLLAGAALGGLLGARLPDWPWVLVALAAVAGASYLDDRGHVDPRLRLGVHLLAGALLVIGGLGWSSIELPGLQLPLPGPVSWALTLLFVVWMVNLYNFMDGMDGFAGGMAVFGFGALAVLGWRAGDTGFATLAAVIAAAAAGFLTRNFPPARIFLGDVGSASLGLLAAALSLIGARDGLFPLWVAWLVFSPFILDATWTLIARALAGKRIWQAHREHHYQRLVLAGWSHRRTVLRAYLLMAACAASAIGAATLATHEQALLLVAWGAIYLLVHVKVGLVERRGATA